MIYSIVLKIVVFPAIGIGLVFIYKLIFFSYFEKF